MSLRAKLEAVIYAAEEPVTLAQLSTLFAAEALAERGVRAELDAQDDGPRSAESAAEAYSQAPATDAEIEQAVEHPEQVSETQADGFAGEPSERMSELETAEARRNETRDLEQASRASRDSDSKDEAEQGARSRGQEAREEIRRLVDELIDEYDNGDRGVEIREIAGGYRVATKPEYHDAVRGFVRSLKPPMKLSLQALETLAVIAYKQPVTAPEVSEIRGVDSGGVLGSLISRKLVTTAGRKQVIGRPILYKTTKEFLLRFGLKDVNELPSMEEFEKMAGELAETEAAPLADGASQASAQTGEQPAEGETSVNTGENAARWNAEPDGEPGRESGQELDGGAGQELNRKSDGELGQDLNREMGQESGQESDGASDQKPNQEPGRASGQELNGRPGDQAMPSAAEEVQAAPELAKDVEDEELVAKARAAVQVDDESAPNTDLPGVHRDTAGTVNIDSKPHLPNQRPEEL